MIKGIWLIVTHHSGNELNVYGWTTNLLIFARRNRAHVMIARQQSGWSWMSWDPLVCIIKSIILFHFFFCVLFFSILLCLVLFYSLQFNSISPEILFFCGFPILLYAVHTHTCLFCCCIGVATRREPPAPRELDGEEGSRA